MPSSNHSLVVTDNEDQRGLLTVTTVRNAPIKEGRLQTVMTFGVGQQRISVDEADAKEIADFILRSFQRK